MSTITTNMTFDQKVLLCIIDILDDVQGDSLTTASIRERLHSKWNTPLDIERVQSILIQATKNPDMAAGYKSLRVVRDKTYPNYWKLQRHHVDTEQPVYGRVTTKLRRLFTE